MERRPPRDPPRKVDGAVIIGWREWVALPDLGIETIKAKIDTGARTSALHAVDLETFRRRGRDYVRFGVHPIQRDDETEVKAEAEVVEYRSIRSSNGVSEERPVIMTDVSWTGFVWPVELTLTRRDEMGFRLLLGRQAIREKMYVDAGRSFYGGEPDDEA